MKCRTLSRRIRGSRAGAAAIEFAIVAIPLFTFILGSIEIGRGIMAVKTMEESARAGCRHAIIKGATSASVEAEVETLMSRVGIDDFDVNVDPTDFSAAERWDSITVTVTADIDDISWVPMPNFLAGKTFTSACTLPKESAPGE